MEQQSLDEIRAEIEREFARYDTAPTHDPYDYETRMKDMSDVRQYHDETPFDRFDEEAYTRTPAHWLDNEV